MNINWKVRINNPIFWRNIAISIIAPVLTYLGINWTDITTWAALGEVFKQAISNPVIIVSVLTSIWNAINDPTSSGDSDSKLAMTYEIPNSIK